MEKADGGKFFQIVKEYMERCSHMEPQDFRNLIILIFIRLIIVIRCSTN